MKDFFKEINGTAILLVIGPVFMAACLIFLFFSTTKQEDVQTPPIPAATERSEKYTHTEENSGYDNSDERVEYIDPAEMELQDIETDFYSNDEIVQAYKDSHEFGFDQIEHLMEDMNESSLMTECGYSDVWNVLAIRFRNSGICYAFYEVPHSVYFELVTADSAGAYFQKNIRDKYEYDIID